MKNRIRYLLGFVAAAVILQGLALLFLTPAGLERIYPYPARLTGERFRPETNTYAVYYDTRKEISEADLVVIGADAAVAETFDVLGHFTRFAKQYNNFSAVMLDLTEEQLNVWNDLMKSEEEEIVAGMLEMLHGEMEFSEDYCGYAAELYFVNRTMSPVKRFDVLSYAVREEESVPDTLAERVALCLNGTERSAICVVDSRELENGSRFRDELTGLAEERGWKIVFLQTHYAANGASPETHREYRFPFAPAEPAVYFVKNSRMDFYYRYYTFVNDLLGISRETDDRLDTRATDYYFIISGGTAAE